MPKEELYFDDREHSIDYFAEVGKGYPEFNPSQERDESGRWTSGGPALPDVEFEEADAESFLEAVRESKRPLFLTKHTKESLDKIIAEGGKLYLSDDGKTGYILTGEGDAQNLFNNGGPKGAGRVALIDAIARGAKTLDCFDGFLPQLYHDYGFTVYDVWKFNDEYAPEGWDYDRLDRPDVILMRYDRKSRDRDEIKRRVGTYGTFEKPERPAA